MLGTQLKDSVKDDTFWTENLPAIVKEAYTYPVEGHSDLHALIIETVVAGLLDDRQWGNLREAAEKCSPHFSAQVMEQYHQKITVKLETTRKEAVKAIIDLRLGSRRAYSSCIICPHCGNFNQYSNCEYKELSRAVCRNGCCKRSFIFPEKRG